MKHYIGSHQFLSATDFLELALGTPVELWLGEPGETELERAARLDAARDILAADPDLFDRVSHIAVEAIERTARELVAA